VDVHLHDLELAAVRAGQLLDDGRDLATWSAPGDPEVNQDRHGSLQHLGLELVVADLLDIRHGGFLLWVTVMSNDCASTMQRGALVRRAKRGWTRLMSWTTDRQS